MRKREGLGEELSGTRLEEVGDATGLIKDKYITPPEVPVDRPF